MHARLYLWAQIEREEKWVKVKTLRENGEKPKLPAQDIRPYSSHFVCLRH